MARTNWTVDECLVLPITLSFSLGARDDRKDPGRTRYRGWTGMPGKEVAGNAQAVTTGREPAVEARALAYLYAAGAGLAALSLALPHSPMQDDLGITAVIAVACAGALGLLIGAPRIPTWAVQCFIAVGTLLISLVVHFSGAGDSAFAFYYVWVGIYAFYFLPRAWAIAQSALVAVTYGALLLFDDLPADAPAA